MALVGAAVQAGASVLDTLVGFSFSSILDPVNNQQTAILGQFYTLFAVMVMLMSGGDHIMIEGLGASYHALPITAYPHIGAVTAGHGDRVRAGVDDRTRDRRAGARRARHHRRGDGARLTRRAADERVRDRHARQDPGRA